MVSIFKGERVHVSIMILEIPIPVPQDGTLEECYDGKYILIKDGFIHATSEFIDTICDMADDLFPNGGPLEIKLVGKR